MYGRVWVHGAIAFCVAESGPRARVPVPMLAKGVLRPVTLILRGPSNVTLMWIRPTYAYQRSMVGGLGARRPVMIFPSESRPLRIRLGGAKDPGRRAG